MRKTDQVKIFGAALDCLDDPERLALKIAFVEARARGRIPSGLPADPFDAIAPLINNAVPSGKVEIPDWVTPRPRFTSAYRLAAESHREFMDAGGPAAAAKRAGEIFTGLRPALPVMVAVDHALTSGPVAALSREAGPENLALIVVDSHFDAIPPRLRCEAAADFDGADLCGEFLAGLIEDGSVLPGNLFVIGVSDFPGGAAAGSAFGRAYNSFLERGAKVYPKSRVRRPDFGEQLARDLATIRARTLYVSLDADIGASAACPAVRFSDAVGLSEDELMRLADEIGGIMAGGGSSLGGMDVCEVDVHLLGLPGDRTAEVCAGFVERVIGSRKEKRAGTRRSIHDQVPIQSGR